MSCAAKARPQDTPLDRVRFVTDHLPRHLFRSVAGTEVPDTAATSWRIAPQPFPLSPTTVSSLQTLGGDLLAFYRAINKLYYQSVRGSVPDFVRRYLEIGKPEHIIRLQRQNRFKQDLPGLIRPDIILTEGGMIASELDSVPGGMGFVGAMGATYCELGYDQVGEYDGIVRGFARMAQALTSIERPLIAIIVSTESEDYRGEMLWLAQAVRDSGLADAVTIKPEELVFTEDALIVETPDGGRTVDLVYRFFELFDVLNVPKQELVFYAARHKRVVVNPPAKSFLEEKLAFALFHLPVLEAWWRMELSPDVFSRLRRVLPDTWILDPQSLPPQADISGLTVGGKPVQSWSQLYGLSKSERQYVVKPSGFSELAWGSKGVKVANDLTRDEWMAVIDGGLAMYEKTPHVLQRFHKARRVQTEYFDAATEQIKTMDGRARLCPYYFVVGDEALLSGILATIVPVDKRLIHGMADAVMAPCMVAETGY
ncbi:MAG: hypothetical protein GIW99_07565 [Candidatus Eremiobacteraeota bacterium]|nr:hypothetical protein [Candidatus Eremiobacteraeota bacterium]MBC5827519.1 hypothetical protein [Candidatus Eremiobacteraeota bacterium]